MTVAERRAEFVSTLDRERASLQGTAYLLVDDPRSAAGVLDGTLAQLYARQVAPAEVRLEALRSLVSNNAPPAVLPWARAREFELLDGPLPAESHGIVADLRGLPHDQRAALVLKHFTALPSAQIADLLGRPLEDVELLARQARTALTAGHPERETDDGLAAELRAALPYDWQSSHGGVTDVARGHRLIRWRWLRRGAVAAAAVVALVLLVGQLWPHPAPDPEPLAQPPAISGPPVARANCDTRDTGCRETLLQDWRATMVAVANEHLDRDQSDPFRLSSAQQGRDSGWGSWSDQGGVLTVELARSGRGATQLSVQIASSRAYAVPCGQTTGTTCATTRFMDGNRFTMTESDLLSGVEVQYSPYGDEVITVIARPAEPGRAARGQEPTVGRPDLVDLIQDRRLRLPAR